MTDHSSIERQAKLISDPVGRLRFLRREMASRGTRRRRAGAPLTRQAAWVAAAAALMMVPAPIPTGATETFLRERRLLVPTAQTGAALDTVPKVWLVEASKTLEVYSNGLRIDREFAVSNRPRATYPIFPLAGAAAPVKNGNAPAGIVYHTTESLLAPFEEEKNGQLTWLGRNLVEVIRREHAYHYLIDRFGRVFRVVEESDAANHVGKSVWADSGGIYVNLNDSFLGVAFEGQTGAAGEVTPAQISSGRQLTEMLRDRYHIPAESCVTHAQVSVNPSNMLIGEHTDWAAKFPFAAVGLPDNYSIAIPSMYAFGFDYDSVFLNVIGTRWKGLDLAKDQVRRQAAAEGLSAASYQKSLRLRFRNVEATLAEQTEGGT